MSLHDILNHSVAGFWIIPVLWNFICAVTHISVRIDPPFSECILQCRKTR
jgi:hypothetical protein